MLLDLSTACAKLKLQVSQAFCVGLSDKLYKCTLISKCVPATQNVYSLAVLQCYVCTISAKIWDIRISCSLILVSASAPRIPYAGTNTKHQTQLWSLKRAYCSSKRGAQSRICQSTNNLAIVDCGKNIKYKILSISLCFCHILQLDLTKFYSLNLQITVSASHYEHH